MSRGAVFVLTRTRTGRSQQPGLERAQYGLDAVADAELGENARDVDLDRALGGAETRYTAAHRGGPTWLYRFTLAASAKMGAFHGAELHLLFATPGGPHTAAAASAADALRRYWVQFATTGDPNQAGLPTWPAYRDPPPRWLDIGEQVRTIDGFDRPGCDVFDRAY